MNFKTTFTLIFHNWKHKRDKTTEHTNQIFPSDWLLMPPLILHSDFTASEQDKLKLHAQLEPRTSVPCSDGSDNSRRPSESTMYTDMVCELPGLESHCCLPSAAWGMSRRWACCIQGYTVYIIIGGKVTGSDGTPHVLRMDQMTRDTHQNNKWTLTLNLHRAGLEDWRS